MTINLSYFANNTASYGGAVHLRHCDVTMSKVVFVFNVAIYNGGAAFFKDCHDAIVIESRYVQNSAKLAGGGIWTQSSELFIVDSYFNENSAITTGGAVKSDSMLSRSMTVNRSMFTSNRAHDGGALFTVKSRVMINMSAFMSNKATETGGALFFVYSSVECIGNITLTKNVAAFGASVFSHSVGSITGVVLVRQNIGSFLIFDSMVRIETKIDVIDNVLIKK